MPDLYANWAALSAAEELSVDYRLPIRRHRSITASIAIHGGAIEPGSSEIASAVAARCRHNYYSLEGIKSSGNSDLHITSTNYDEPQALTLVKSMDYCLSFHGMVGTAGVAETFVGGLDTANRDAVLAALQGAGFTASVGNSELDGSDLNNITNRTRLLKGVQIEMSNQQRANFFPSGDLSRSNRETGIRTQAFYDYVKAIAFAVNGLGGGAEQAPFYTLNIATPDDPMSDFETWINSSWDKLTDAASPNSGTTLPSSGNYNIGDRFYKSNTQSIYILICKDPNWGWHWRPVQDAISPWKVVPTTCLADASWTLNPVAANPFAIAFDNRGKCYWRGVIGPSSGNIARNQSHFIFKKLVGGLIPRQTSTYMLGHSTLAVGTDGTNLNSYQGARVYIPGNATENISIRCFGGTADYNRVRFAGVNYAPGTGRYFTP